MKTYVVHFSKVPLLSLSKPIEALLLVNINGTVSTYSDSSIVAEIINDKIVGESMKVDSIISVRELGNKVF